MKKMKAKNKKMIKLVTHNGSFHADDVFACATLCLYLEKKGKKFSAKGGPASGWKVIRTRDEKIIASGDYVFDVGGIYDPKINRFDHHQVSFKEKRKNGITYSSFGLIWKKYGKDICQSEEIKNHIDKLLVEQVDARDNGMDIFKPLTSHVFNYDVSGVISSFRPNWKEKNSRKHFNDAVKFARSILEKEIKQFYSVFEIKLLIKRVYKKSKNKKLLVLNMQIPRYLVDLASKEYKKLLFIIFKGSNDWKVLAVKKKPGSFANKKNLPKSWGGINNKKLQKITGVNDAIFCHKRLFLAGAKSKTGALKLAQLALK